MARCRIKRNDERVKKSLRYSILDGTFYSVMVGFGESFFSAFGVFMKATNAQLGLLGSLPQAIGSLSLLFSNKLLRLFKSRKKLVCTFALVEALLYIPIAFVFFFGTLRVLHLILFTCLYFICAMVINPAWSSWMGDLVNEEKRGSYFGRRNRIAGFASFISFMLGGYILQQFADGTTTQYTGFLVIFGLALISRVVSFIYLTKKYEPIYVVHEEERFGFINFIKQARFKNYGLLVMYLCFMNFAVFLAAPFFTAYMLYDLKMTYMTFALVNAVSLIAKYLSMPLWGRASDRFGTRNVVGLTGFLMPLVPILWLFSTKLWYLILIQAYSGFVWAGFELASFNFIFDATLPERRATYIAYYNVLNGACLFLGAIVGSVIVMHNHIFWSAYLFIFLISGIVRCIASFVFVPKLKEVREVEHIHYPELFLKVVTNLPEVEVIQSVAPLAKNSLRVDIKQGKKVSSIHVPLKK